jgi:hypothetical protein
MILNYCGDQLMSSIGVKDGAPYLGFIRRCDVPLDILEKVDGGAIVNDEDRERITNAVADVGVLIRMEEPRAAFALMNLMSMMRSLVMSPFDSPVEEGEAPFNPVSIH